MKLGFVEWSGWQMGGFGSRGKLSTFVGAGLKARPHYKLMHCTDTRFVKQFPRQREMQQLFWQQDIQYIATTRNAITILTTRYTNNYHNKIYKQLPQLEMQKKIWTSYGVSQDAILNYHLHLCVRCQRAWLLNGIFPRDEIDQKAF